MKTTCIRCKGRGFCGRDFCAVYAKANAAFKVQKLLTSASFSGKSPAPFVGRVGYPYLNVGILSPAEQVENAWEYDAPRHWAENSYEIPRIIDLRTSLINSRFKTHVKQQDKLLEISREIGMASKPVELEIQLTEKPAFRANFDASLAPMGPNAKLEKAEITSNPKIPREVDKAVSDKDLKANEAITQLYKMGHDENFLAKLLSVGNLGVGCQRKLVPTRWSITAVDDLLGKQAIERIRSYPEDDNLFFAGNYLGNYYLVMVFSGMWSYELFETYVAGASWNVSSEVQYSTDYEPFAGRTSYAENCAGGYYAARLTIAEKLAERKRQASVLCLRFITGEYAAPLGVWVCRESSRKAMQSRPISFDDQQTMVKYCHALILRKFGYDITNILKESKLLAEQREQTKLNKFIQQKTIKDTFIVQQLCSKKPLLNSLNP